MLRSSFSSASFSKLPVVPVAEILRTADWTNERTFRKYYLESRLFSIYVIQGSLLEDLYAIKYVNF